MTVSGLPDSVRESRVATAGWWGKHGVPLGTLRECVSSGDLVRTRRGVYATKAAVLEAAADARAEHALRVKSAVAFIGGDAVACYSSAALIHGLDMLTAPPADVVTLLRPDARKRNRKSSGDIQFRAAALVPGGARERDHLTESYGVRVTTAPRTVVDLARELPFMAKMSEKGANRKQYRRDGWLRDAGYKVVHVSWRELFYEQEVVISNIRKAFAAPSVY